MVCMSQLILPVVSMLSVPGQPNAHAHITDVYEQDTYAFCTYYFTYVIKSATSHFAG